MTPRTVEDRLREEYFRLRPDIKRILHRLQTDVAYLLLALSLDLKHHERIHIEGRAKECDSAIDALRRREELRQFDEEAPGKYSLTSLPDLAALRVLVFPKSRLEEVHEQVRAKYADWTSDPVTTESRRDFGRGNIMDLSQGIHESEQSYRLCLCSRVFFGRSNMMHSTSPVIL